MRQPLGDSIGNLLGLGIPLYFLTVNWKTWIKILLFSFVAGLIKNGGALEIVEYLTSV